jgi:hypothetical protein
MPGPAQPYVAGDEGGNAHLLGYRLTFLRAMGLVAPHAVGALRADVLPLFRAAWEESPPFTQGHFWPRGWEALSRIPDEMHGPGLPAFRDALIEWADAHNLNEPWLLDAALKHLRYELELGEALPFGSTGGTVAYWEPALNAKPPEYRPQQQTRAEYLADIQTYIDDVQAEYQRAGWSPAPPPGEIMKQLLWLARHQVLGMTYKEVMEAASADDASGDTMPDRSTVRRHIQRAAEAVGLTLRPAPRR